MWEGKKKLILGLVVGVLIGYAVAGHHGATIERPERHPPVVSRSKQHVTRRHVVVAAHHKVYPSTGPRPTCTRSSTLAQITSHACVPG